MRIPPDFRHVRNLPNNAILAWDELACGELRVDSYKYFLDVYKKERL